MMELEDTKENLHTDPFDNLDDLFEKVTDYTETRLSLFKLKATERASVIASEMAGGLIFFTILFLGVIVLNIGLGFLLGDLLGKVYYGFFVLAAFYIIAGFIFKAVCKKPVINAIANLVIRKIL